MSPGKDKKNTEILPYGPSQSEIVYRVLDQHSHQLVRDLRKQYSYSIETVRHEVPALLGDEVRAINYFRGLPERVKVTYLREHLGKSFLLLDWQLSLVVMPVAAQVFYEVLLRTGLPLFIWTGETYQALTEPFDSPIALQDVLANLPFTPACAEALTEKLGRVLDLHNYELVDFAWVQRYLYKLRGIIESSFKDELPSDHKLVFHCNFSVIDRRWRRICPGVPWDKIDEATFSIWKGNNFLQKEKFFKNLTQVKKINIKESITEKQLTLLCKYSKNLASLSLKIADDAVLVKLSGLLKEISSLEELNLTLEGVRRFDILSQPLFLKVLRNLEIAKDNRPELIYLCLFNPFKTQSNIHVKIGELLIDRFGAIDDLKILQAGCSSSKGSDSIDEEIPDEIPNKIFCFDKEKRNHEISSEQVVSLNLFDQTTATRQAPSRKIFNYMNLVDNQMRFELRVNLAIPVTHQPKSMPFDLLTPSLLRSAAAECKYDLESCSMLHWTEAVINFGGAFSGGLNREKIVLPLITAEILYIACDDASLQFVVERAFPTAQLVVCFTNLPRKLWFGIKLRLRYIYADLPAALIEIPSVTRFLPNRNISGLLRMLFGPGLPNQHAYPNFIYYREQVDKIVSQHKEMTTAVYQKLADLTAMYCGDDQKTEPMRGFTSPSAPTKAYPSAIEQIRITLEQKGDFLVRAVIFTQLCTHLEIPWLLYDDSEFVFPAVFIHQGEDKYRCVSYKSLEKQPILMSVPEEKFSETMDIMSDPNNPTYQMESFFASLTRLKQLAINVQDKQQLIFLVKYGVTLTHLTLKIDVHKDILSDVPTLLAKIPSLKTLTLILGATRRFEALAELSIAQRLTELTILVDVIPQPFPLAATNPLTAMTTLTIYGLVVDLAHWKKPAGLTRINWVGCRFKNFHARKLLAELQNCTVSDGETVRQFSSPEDLTKFLDKILPEEKSGEVMDTKTGSEDIAYILEPWYEIEDAKQDRPDWSSLRESVRNYVSCDDQEIRFETKVSSAEPLAPAPVIVKDFARMNKTMLQQAAAAWAKKYPKGRSQKKGDFFSWLYLATIDIDLSGKESGGLGENWVLLKSVSFHEQLLYISCSDPTVTIQQTRRAFPVYQFAIQLIPGAIVKSHYQLAYICATLPNAPVPMPLFSQQVDGNIEALLVKLMQQALNSKSLLAKSYPNFARYVLETQKIQKSRIRWVEKEKKLADLMAIYCGTDDSKSFIRGFSLGELPERDFSQLLGCTLSPALNNLVKLILGQKGCCRHRAQVYVLLQSAMDARWLMRQNKVHLAPEALVRYPRSEFECILYTYLNTRVVLASAETQATTVQPIADDPCERPPSLVPTQNFPILAALFSYFSFWDEKKPQPAVRPGTESLSPLTPALTSAPQPPSQLQLQPVSQPKTESLPPPTPVSFTVAPVPVPIPALSTPSSPAMDYRQEAFARLAQMAEEFKPIAHWALESKYSEFCKKLLEQRNPLIQCSSDDMSSALVLALLRYIAKHHSSWHCEWITEDDDFFLVQQRMQQYIVKKIPVVWIIDWTHIERLRFQSILDQRRKLGKLLLPDDPSLYQVISLTTLSHIEIDFAERCKKIPFPQQLSPFLQALAQEISSTSFLSPWPQSAEIPAGAQVISLGDDAYWLARLLGSKKVTEYTCEFQHTGLAAALQERRIIILNDPPSGKQLANFIKFWQKAYALQYVVINGECMRFSWLVKDLEKPFHIFTRHTPIIFPAWIKWLEQPHELKAWQDRTERATILTLNPEKLYDFLPDVVTDKEGTVVTTQGATLLEKSSTEPVLIETTAELPPQCWRQLAEQFSRQPETKIDVAIVRKQVRKLEPKEALHFIIESNDPQASERYLRETKQISSTARVAFITRETRVAQVLADMKMVESKEGTCKFPREIYALLRDLRDGHDRVLVAVDSQALTPNLFFQLESILRGTRKNPGYYWLNGEKIIVTGQLTLIINYQEGPRLWQYCNVDTHTFEFTHYEELLTPLIEGSNWLRLLAFYNLTQPICRDQLWDYMLCRELLPAISSGSWLQIEPLINAMYPTKKTELISCFRVLAKLIFCAPDSGWEDSKETQPPVPIADAVGKGDWSQLDRYLPRALATILQIRTWEEVWEHLLAKDQLQPVLAERYQKLWQSWLAAEPSKVEKTAADSQDDLCAQVIDILITRNKPVAAFIGPAGAGKTSIMVKTVKRKLAQQGRQVAIYWGMRAGKHFLQHPESKVATTFVWLVDEANMKPKDTWQPFIWGLSQNPPYVYYEGEFYPINPDTDKLILTGNFLGLPGRVKLPCHINTLIFSALPEKFLREQIIYPLVTPLDKWRGKGVERIADICLAGYYWLIENLPHQDFSSRDIQDALKILLVLHEQTEAASIERLCALTFNACYRRFTEFLLDPAIQLPRLEKVLRTAAGDSAGAFSVAPLPFPQQEAELKRQGLSLPPSALRFVRQIFEVLALRRYVLQGGVCLSKPISVVQAPPGWGKSTLIEACVKIDKLVNADSMEAKTKPPTEQFVVMNMGSEPEKSAMQHNMAQGSCLLLDEFNTMALPLEADVNFFCDLIANYDDLAEYAAIEEMVIDPKNLPVHRGALILATQNSTELENRKLLSSALQNRCVMIHTKFDRQNLLHLAEHSNYPYPQLLVESFYALQAAQKSLDIAVSGLRHFREVVEHKGLPRLSSVSLWQPAMEKGISDLVEGLQKLIDVLIAVCGGTLPEANQRLLVKHILANETVKELFVNRFVSAAPRISVRMPTELNALRQG